MTTELTSKDIDRLLEFVWIFEKNQKHHANTVSVIWNEAIKHEGNDEVNKSFERIKHVVAFKRLSYGRLSLPVDMIKILKPELQRNGMTINELHDALEKYLKENFWGKKEGQEKIEQARGGIPDAFAETISSLHDIVDEIFELSRDWDVLPSGRLNKMKKGFKKKVEEEIANLECNFNKNATTRDD
jgi:hypothetical protein